MRGKNAIPRVLWFCCLLAGIGFKGYGDTPPVLGAGTFPVAGAVSGLGLIHDGAGTVYVLAQPGGEAGSMTIARKQGEGEWAPYKPGGLPETITKARRLVLSAPGPVQYAAFIAQEEGLEALYVLGLDDTAELVYYPLPETRSALPIDGYALRVAADGSASVFVLTGGVLRLISGAGRGGLRTVRDISSPGERVLDFDAAGDPQRRRVSGWYRFSRAGKNEFTLFLELENSLVQRRSLGAYSGSARVRSGMTLGGETTTLIMDGKRVELYRHNDNGIIAEIRFEAPLPARRYISAAETGGDRGLLVCGDETQSVLYGVIHEKSGAPEFPVYLRPEDGFLAEMLYTGENRVLLVYQENQSWFTADIDLNRGLQGTASLPAEGDYRGWLSPDPGGPPRLCFVRADPSPTLTVYAPRESDPANAVRYTQHWEPLASYSLPPELLADPAEGAEPGDGLPAGASGLFMAPSKSVLALEGPENGELQILRGQPRAFSSRINGGIYFALYADGTLSFYRQEE
jgi:hypothetical protein